MTFLDTNICLDFLVKRSPWHETADKIIRFHINNHFEMGVSVISIPTLAYLIDRHHKEYESSEILKEFSEFIHFLEVDSSQTKKAIFSDWNDLEDAMQFQCAFSNKVQTIITRNTKDFQLSTIPVFHPKEWAKTFIDNA
ncbi:MAG: PIN domain-containing protein [Gracilimonas sp.]